jgi:CheY-like chemotaxis protein
MKLLDILLVDDDDNDCALFGIAADKADLNIHLQTVTSGEQAIDYLEGRCVYADRSLYRLPDLVVLDLDMRLTGGLDFLNWRRASTLSSLPVVIFSEFAYQGTIETALAMGASTYIAKPLDFEGWEAVVQQILDWRMERSEPMKAPCGSVAGDSPPVSSLCGRAAWQ